MVEASLRDIDAKLGRADRHLKLLDCEARGGQGKPRVEDPSVWKTELSEAVCV
jgi:hypothetical protein